MSNVLKVSLQTTISSLYDRGWSRRRIARELKIDRKTVGRYLLLRAKPAIPTAGSDVPDGPEPAISTAGSGEGHAPNPAISTAGKGAGRKSQCEPLAQTIEAKVEVGLSAQRIFQDLVQDHGFSDSYESVKRFVRKHRVTYIRPSPDTSLWACTVRDSTHGAFRKAVGPHPHRYHPPTFIVTPRK